VVDDERNVDELGWLARSIGGCAAVYGRCEFLSVLPDIYCSNDEIHESGSKCLGVLQRTPAAEKKQGRTIIRLLFARTADLLSSISFSRLSCFSYPMRSLFSMQRASGKIHSYGTVRVLDDPFSKMDGFQ